MSVTIAMPRMSTDPELTTAQSKYVESLARAGAEVHWVALSDSDAAVTEALTCDGLLLPGGGDMDPAFYGQERIPACGEPNLLRDAAEPKLLRAFLAADKPVLGICRGIQLANVALGGTLIQDLPSQHRREDGQPSIDHRQTALGAYASHRVVVAEGSLLEQILGQQELWVNSFHHQAVEEVAGQANLSAWAADGVVEAIELPDAPFVLGVQWHPEKMTQAGDEASRRLFAAFAEAARR